MIMKKNGLTLIESLVSICLLSMLIIGLVGIFFVSKIGASRAKHRVVVMNILKQYMAQETRAGYDGGSDDEGDYYATVSSAAPVPVVIDDRGTIDTADDLIGTITPDPYYPDNIENSDGTQINYNGVPFKIIGFVVNWNEDSGAVSERAVTYVAYHSSAA